MRDLKTPGSMRTFVFGLLVGAFGMLAVGAVVFGLGLIPVAATTIPSSGETFLARKMLAAALSRQAPKVQNPFPPTSDNLRAGLRLYRAGCSGCHGDRGNPSRWGTSGFYPRVPQFDSEPPVKPDWQLFWVVKHGVRYTGMGAWENLAPDDQTWKVVGFLSHLNNLPLDVEAEWRQPSR